MTPPIRLILFAALLALAQGALVGCASFTHASRHQSVLIRTEPSGAEVSKDGEIIGRTPLLASLHRERKPVLEIESDKGPLEVELKTKYRWRDSFFSNFIFLTYAPIGWLVDTLTGSAWELKDPDVVQISKLSDEDKAYAQEHKPQRTASIAPPQAASIALSDAGGVAIESALKRSDPTLQLVPFRETLADFVSAGYDYDGKPTSPAERRELYKNVGTQFIYESAIETREDEIVLRAQAHDVYSGGDVAPLELRLKPDGELKRLYATDGWWSRILPNNVGIDFLSERTEVRNSTSIAGEPTTYDLQPGGQEAWWSAGLRYLSAINISSLPQRRYGRASRWEFDLVPAFRLSRRQVKAPGTDGLPDDPLLVRWWVSGGYGPEIGYQVSRHYFYFNIIPQLYWSEISWSEDGRYHSESGKGIQMLAETGYVFFYTANWNLKLFSRAQTEDVESWSKVIERFQPNTRVGSVSTLLSGLSIAYRFEPEFKAANWFRSSGSAEAR